MFAVEPRFQGPPGAVNGGFVAGLMAGMGPGRVRLRRPVPVGRGLRRRGPLLFDGDDLLVESAPHEVVVDVPPAVGVAQARAAGAATPLAARHPFPGCFGCGPAHPSGQHNLAGPVAGRDGLWAVDWTPTDATAPFVWAALDCPSSAPVVPVGGDPPHVLGEIAAHVLRLPALDEPHVVMAWAVGAEGRRKHAASAVLDASGDVCAVARATWVALRPGG